jgi:hypothetical protein
MSFLSNFVNSSPYTQMPFYPANPVLGAANTSNSFFQFVADAKKNIDVNIVKSNLLVTQPATLSATSRFGSCTAKGSLQGGTISLDASAFEGAQVNPTSVIISVLADPSEYNNLVNLSAYATITPASASGCEMDQLYIVPHLLNISSASTICIGFDIILGSITSHTLAGDRQMMWNYNLTWVNSKIAPSI